jgi:hypothetical protein
VEGGGDLLSGECRRLLIGQALKSGHEKELDRFPITNPVAWIKTIKKPKARSSLRASVPLSFHSGRQLDRVRE